MSTGFSPADLSRRNFIRSCCAAVGSTGLLSAMAQLRLMGAVAGDHAGDDYKALVCLFMNGGNDANNLIVPYDTSGYNAYAAARTTLALPQSSLLPITPLSTDGRSYGLHGSVGPLAELFATGKLAMLANVGTLVVPTTRAQYEARSVPLPAQLFSHNDQQVQWQSSVSDQPFSSGWGGRLADLMNAFNENPALSMSISLDGQNSFQVGNSVSQFAVNRTGVVDLRGTEGAAGEVRMDTLKQVLGQENESLFQTAFGDITSSAIDTSAVLGAALENATPLTTEFPEGRLGEQLAMIARLISVAPQFGLKRQVFFARLGGWDLHDTQIDAHALLLDEISRGMKSFYDATVELGCEDDVTTFSASDFGRTFNTNGDGSDHGWGSHHFVMGGAVRGGDIYGTMPVLEINGPDDTGRGRWIPTTSVDEYAATLASWFGVSATDLPMVLPNIGRFERPNLGFMR
jgi:uncharacterized protein (DUF1501 family)